MWLVIEATLMLTKELQQQQQQIYQQERRANSKGFWFFLGCKEMKAYLVNMSQNSLLQTHSKDCFSGDLRSPMIHWDDSCVSDIIPVDALHMWKKVLMTRRLNRTWNCQSNVSSKFLWSHNWDLGRKFLLDI